MGASLYTLDKRSVRLDTLDKRSVRLATGKTIYRIGTLRRFWKITEMTAVREQELRQTADAVTWSPQAVMLAEPCQKVTIISDNPSIQNAHQVLGWNLGQVKTNDFAWGVDQRRSGTSMKSKLPH
jgi:hypothetical protein